MLADLLPAAEHRVLAGQTHMVKAKALAPLLIDAFGGSPAAHPDGADRLVRDGALA